MRAGLEAQREHHWRKAMPLILARVSWEGLQPLWVQTGQPSAGRPEGGGAPCPGPGAARLLSGSLALWRKGGDGCEHQFQVVKLRPGKLSDFFKVTESHP